MTCATCHRPVADDDDDAVAGLCGRCVDDLLEIHPWESERDHLGRFKRLGKATRKSAYCGTVGAMVTRKPTD